MPRLSPPIHTALREAVAARFGQALRYPSHCDALEAELLKAADSGGRRISPSTLRRFFGLVEKEGGYHLYTLDTLARYAGHVDFEAFGQAVTGIAGKKTQAAPADIPELLAMERLAHPERLLLGYFLGRVTRPATPNSPAAALALRLAAHPAGQEFYVESFVDLAYLNGAYGEVLAEYLRHNTTAQAQLFGNAALFLGEFLAENERAWRPRLQHLLALPVPPETHAFPRGRRAFAEVVAAWYDAPDQRVPAPLLARLQADAAMVPHCPTPLPTLPAFYNLFPAGYHFFVAEALFLTGEFEALLAWLGFTQGEFPELAALEHNVYNELLRAFRAVALLRTSRETPGFVWSPLLFSLETHTWLLDYFQVHIALVDLHFALAAGNEEPAADALRNQIHDFATAFRMPFFERVAQNIDELPPARGPQR